MLRSINFLILLIGMFIFILLLHNFELTKKISNKFIEYIFNKNYVNRTDKNNKIIYITFLIGWTIIISTLGFFCLQFFCNFNFFNNNLNILSSLIIFYIIYFYLSLVIGKIIISCMCNIRNAF